jgi:dTMP kinase
LRGPIGTLLRSVLRRELSLDLATIALLFAADRADHVEREIRPAIASGALVVSDRYLASSLAYQSLHLDLAWVQEINARAPRPDLTIYLRIDPSIARSRRSLRGGPEELFDDHQLQLQISARYDAILGSSPAAGSWIQLDPAGSGWIRRDPPGSSSGSAPIAILDGALQAEALHQQLKLLLEKVAPPIGS